MQEWQLNHMIDLDNFTKIMRALPVNEVTYHVYGSFGDVYMQLSALKELSEEKDEVFHILIDEKYAILAGQALSNKIGKFYADGGSLNNIFNKIKLIGKTGSLPIRLLPTLYPGCAELILSRRLSYANFLRGIIGSKKEGLFSKIEDTENLKKQAEDIILKSNCIPGQTILLSLDNNTHKEFSENFWMEIIQLIHQAGLLVLLNNSGTLSYNSANLLSATNLPRIKVDPNMAVTIPIIAGGYIGGTNGFSTIQALFNDSVPGLHFINAIESESNKIKDKFDNIIDQEQFHSKLLKEEFRGLQIEVLIKNNTNNEIIHEIILEYVKLLTNLPAYLQYKI